MQQQKQQQQHLCQFQCDLIVLLALLVRLLELLKRHELFTFLSAALVPVDGDLWSILFSYWIVVPAIAAFIVWQKAGKAIKPWVHSFKLALSERLRCSALWIECSLWCGGTSVVVARSRACIVVVRGVSFVLPTAAGISPGAR